MSITKISPSVVDFDAGITISTADNLTQLTLTSTDADENSGPQLALTRDSGSPADDDFTGLISFNADDDAGNSTRFGMIRSQIKDASNGAEDGLLDFKVMNAGTERSVLQLNGGGTVIVNQDSQDFDFRVESNDSANMLYVDGGNNKVLIEAQNTDTVSNSATLIAAGVLEINGNAGEGSDHIKMGAMADGTGNQFIEATNSSGASNYKLMINPVNGGNLYSGGNLEFPSGKGIDFSATGDGSGTDSSELLDDYEEGTWTPTVPNGGSVSTNKATYTKIGRTVFYYCYVALNLANDTTQFSLGGLPYSAQATDYYPAGSIGYVGSKDITGTLGPIVAANANYIYFHRYDGNDVSVKNNEVFYGSNIPLIISGTYET